MDPEPSDPLLSMVVLALAVASVGTWFALADRFKHGPLLAYEPRRPVPWSGFWTLLPIAFAAMAVVAAISSEGPHLSAEESPDPGYFERLAFGSLQQVILVALYLAAVIGVAKATPSDLGLPASFSEYARDIKIGVVAWLAALAPVYGAQLLLVLILGKPEGHPLIQMLESQANPKLFIMAFVAAVIVAPLCEELLFRVLLQGWCEKWEDEQLNQLSSPDHAPDERTIQDWSGSIEESTEPLVYVGPARRGIGGAPHGLLPIALSSLVFGFAHVGYGPDPIPLFLLALVIGYVYQRTHRIIPCIVTHALFNGMSLFALWRLVSAT
jgi:membrane protease YdiL (CAAX protease family)